MVIETLSTFPHMYDSVMGASMMKRAQEKGILDFKAYDLRDWTHDRHRTTDDDPYGGGAGLVMKCEPIFEALETLAPDSVAAFRGDEASVRDASAPEIILLAPQGRRFDDGYANELAAKERLLFVCGHYEGIDERVYEVADHVISLGDYVLTSGELASMVIIDAVVRKIDGVLGAEGGAADESFANCLLEYPQYTRPASFYGHDVPAVLASGDHGAVARWRRQQSLERTARWRPDLLEAAEARGDLSPADREYLLTLREEQDAVRG